MRLRLVSFLRGKGQPQHQPFAALVRAIQTERTFPNQAGDTSSPDTRSKGPLAIPFAVQDAKSAAASFEAWKADTRRSMWQAMYGNHHGKGQAGAFKSENIQLQRARPVYLPFFAFDSGKVLKFRGGLGYSKEKNKGHHHWYYTDITLQLECRGALDMIRYAGLAYRSDLVQRAMHPPRYTDNAWYGHVPRVAPPWKGLSALLDQARPLETVGPIPHNCVIQPFEVKPSVCFAELRAEALEHAVLPRVAEAHLRRLDLRDTFVSRSGYHC
jgi:hypothetical protein